MRVALVHDYLNQRGGAERVFAHFVRAWPEAPVYTALYDERLTGDFVPKERVRTSYLARIPGANRYFRYLAPLYPRAFESFDLSAYDTIVSSTSAWAKGVRVAPGAVHICYTSTVSRFAFAYDQYVGGFGLGTLARPLVKRLIAWDAASAALPTQYVANSATVAQRIREYYHRDAIVLHPPVDLDRFRVGAGSGDYFFIASRLLPYKRVDLAIEAAKRANVKLIVAGSGPSEAALRELARGSTTTMLGFVDDETVARLLGDAIAVILPGEEDFGLVPLEAAATGRPTIAYRAGGARETVVEGETGSFFDEQTPEALAEVLRRFDPRAYSVERLRAHAAAFGPQRFVAGLKEIVEHVRAQRG